MSEQKVTWHTRHKSSLTRGDRAADYLRNGMGSWPFVGGFILFMLLWAAANSLALAEHGWDPYPYILLNLLLSMVAGLQGAILLIAAKRQDAIASAMAQHDYDTDKSAKAEIEQLTRINDQQLAILRELQSLLTASNSKP